MGVMDLFLSWTFGKVENKTKENFKVIKFVMQNAETDLEPSQTSVMKLLNENSEWLLAINYCHKIAPS